MSNDNDQDLFRKLYGDIERVQHDHVPEYRKKPRIKKPRDQDKAKGMQSGISPWPDLHDMATSGHEHYTYRADGLQNKVLQRLKRGQLSPEASIDLHGMTRTQALAELQRFIDDCRSRRIKVAHVVHGKGYQSSQGKPVLKPSVALWLKQMPEVLAYSPCLPPDGGEGALYVLLKR